MKQPTQLEPLPNICPSVCQGRCANSFGFGLRDFWVRDATDALYVCQTELRAWYTDYTFGGCH